MLYPAHCYPTNKMDRASVQYRAPLIGYIKTGSDIEDDIISQLNSLFKLQRTVIAGESTFSLMTILKQFVDFGSFVREDEILRFRGNV